MSLIVLVCSVWYVLRPDEINVSETKPEFTVTAENLISHFKDPGNVNIPLETEKVIEVEGIIKEINTLNNRNTVLLEGGSYEPASVICDMQADQIETLKKLKAKDTVKMKGVFKGFLKDAIFLNCVITYSRANE